jgi:hypothetical protein
MYISELAIIIKARFRIYTNIICDDKKTLWELEHCKNNRTKFFNNKLKQAMTKWKTL